MSSQTKELSSPDILVKLSVPGTGEVMIDHLIDLPDQNMIYTLQQVVTRVAPLIGGYFDQSLRDNVQAVVRKFPRPCSVNGWAPVSGQLCLGGGLFSLVFHDHDLVYADHVTITSDPQFTFRRDELGMCIKWPSLSPIERVEFLGSTPDLGRKALVQRADGLMDPIFLRSAFHVARKLASKIGDQQQNLTLGVVVGGRWELGNLSFRLLQQTL